MSLSGASPASFLGGSWSRIAQGRTLFGVNESDSDFSTVEKSAGSKTHRHNFSVISGEYFGHTAFTGGIGSTNPAVGAAIYEGDGKLSSVIGGFRKYSDNALAFVNSNSNSGQNNVKTMRTYISTGTTDNPNNVNVGVTVPYVTTYIWKRTA